jgi:hypothetical protein
MKPAPQDHSFTPNLLKDPSRRYARLSWRMIHPRIQCPSCSNPLICILEVLGIFLLSSRWLRDALSNLSTNLVTEWMAAQLKRPIPGEWTNKSNHGRGSYAMSLRLGWLRLHLSHPPAMLYFSVLAILSLKIFQLAFPVYVSTSPNLWVIKGTLKYSIRCRRMEY